MSAGPALVLGVSHDLAFAAGVFLIGFRRHNPGFAGDVVILHDGIEPQARAALGRIAPRLRLVEFGMARAADRLLATGLLRPRHIRRALSQRSPMILAKFEMFDWLDQYDTLVWCDCDMLVQAPVGDLWQAGPLGWRALPEGAIQRRTDTLLAVEDLLAVHDRPLPNGGVVVAGRALRERWGLGARDLYAMAARLIRDTKAETLDELALFLLACHHRVPVTALDPALNHSVAQPGAEAARILHAIGPDKFWNAAPLRHACPQWDRDHAEWIALGGPAAPAADRLADVHPLAPHAALAAARNRSFWRAVWDGLGPALPPGLWPDLDTSGDRLRLHVPGHGRDLWLELGRTPSAKRLRVSVGLTQGKADPDRIAAALERTGAGLERRGRDNAPRWETDRPLTEIPALLARLHRALTEALPCPPP